MIDPVKKAGSILTLTTSIISLMASIIYLTWFAASLEKRVALLEEQQNQQIATLNDIRSLENENHERQDSEINNLYELLIKGK